jgi:membrane fusion protein (multidrug efflux system)
LQKDNKIRTRSFIPQSRLGDYYVVKSGLKAGETIVYEGLQGLKEGATINPKTIATDSANASAGPAELTAK